MANMPTEITVNVHDDIPDALRDQLVRQLERRSAPIVGNLADLNRLGASTIANSGPDESFRLPAGTDEDEAKAGAQRVLEEEEAAANSTPEVVAGPDEDPADKDPRELERDGNVTSAGASASADTTDSAETTDTTDTGTRRTRRGRGE